MDQIFYPLDDATYDQRTVKLILERTHGFTVCDHVRDFIAGKPIGDNIENAMRASRRFICLLSE